MANHEAMEKNELVDAMQGDFKLFEKLDGDGSGAVTLEEFLAHLKKESQRRDEKKEGRGIEWLRGLVALSARIGLLIN